MDNNTTTKSYNLITPAGNRYPNYHELFSNCSYESWSLAMNQFDVEQVKYIIALSLTIEAALERGASINSIEYILETYGIDEENFAFVEDRILRCGFIRLIK